MQLNLLRHTFSIACAAVAIVLLVSAVKQVLVAISGRALPRLLILELNRRCELRRRPIRRQTGGSL